MCSLDSFYHKYGWYPAIPEDSKETVSMVDNFEKRQSVALSLEHSYDDWCLAQLATATRATNRMTKNPSHPISPSKAKPLCSGCLAKESPLEFCRGACRVFPDISASPIHPAKKTL